MNRVERPQLRGREPSCVSKNEVADADEEARVEKPQSLGVDAFVRIRNLYRPRYFDERDPTRREDVTFRGKVAVECRALPLLDDELDERRRIRVEERRLSAQRGRPLELRMPSDRSRSESD
jgi:hypothetical protein